MRGALAVALLGALALGRAAAQQFQPPREGGEDGTRLGLYGFGLRGGLDWSDGQVVVGAALDVGSLLTERLRLRPSGEIGIDGENSYVASLEALYRFTSDAEPLVPYLGLGASVAGHDDCGADPQCPDGWLNVVFGFERRFRATFNWLVEYHAMDGFRRHRLYFGLTTRRGG